MTFKATLAVSFATVFLCACTSHAFKLPPYSPPIEPYTFDIDISAADAPEGACKIAETVRRQAGRLCQFHSRPPRNNSEADENCRARISHDALQAINHENVTRAFANPKTYCSS